MRLFAKSLVPNARKSTILLVIILMVIIMLLLGITKMLTHSILFDLGY